MRGEGPGENVVDTVQMSLGSQKYYTNDTFPCGDLKTSRRQMGQLGFEPRASRLSAERSYLAELLAPSAHHDVPPRIV